MNIKLTLNSQEYEQLVKKEAQAIADRYSLRLIKVEELCVSLASCMILLDLTTGGKIIKTSDNKIISGQLDDEEFNPQPGDFIFERPK